MSGLFYVLSLKWSTADTFTWWRPENNGYCLCLDDAGKYTREEIDGHPDYYNNGETTRAIAVAVADTLAKRVVPRGIAILDGALPLAEQREMAS